MVNRNIPIIMGTQHPDNANAPFWDTSQQPFISAYRETTEAFENFYKPTPACRADSAQGPCADAYLRARNAFEKEWAKTH